MPFADELISVASIEALGECMAAAAPRRSWQATRSVAGSLSMLGLSGRARVVRDALLADLPTDYRNSEKIISRALRDSSFSGWMIWPVTEAVAARALASDESDAFEAGLAMLAMLTTRLTGEFAIRSFLNSDLDRTLSVVQTWVASDDEQVRRLASEGTRPRLPWAKTVPELFHRPTMTLPILDALHHDHSEYVRRSVANHLNDISRIDADLAVSTARRWVATDGGVSALTRHAMRTLIKQADPGALELLGFGPVADLRVEGPHPHDLTVTMGHALHFDFSIVNTGPDSVKIAVDYVIHYRKANGSLAPRVHKLTTKTLAAGQTYTATRRQAFTPITTRRYYPGEHTLELQVNGTRYGRQTFNLIDGMP
ncbi:DNA alkylation repair protein [Rhodococcus koreensis]|uniref:DNA alkylation repair protein n=1 Tax=Rhodococcus koreensis TaxID=99653 RepID=UPI00197E0BF4|nr:DNA alkylation repair protein [Rhodococcus koreensis]QSE77698.1 DNA alkylation repair protein [Rhodococcus koreensis]